MKESDWKEKPKNYCKSSQRNKDYLKKWKEKQKRNMGQLRYKHLKKAYQIYQQGFSRNKAQRDTYHKNQ